MKPMATPPSATVANSTLAPAKENAPVSTAATASLYSTRPEASFTRLSPSSTTTMRRGMFRRDRIAVAATASGGETMAPNTNATAQGMPGMRNFSVAPTASVVTMTRPMASMPIGRRLALKSRQDVSKAAW